jgi:UDP-N-acetylglucosamine 2-epimerase (non-hydrolysing)
LIKNAEFLASDGATHQQETYYMGKPLLSLRDYTEQIEGIGGNVVLCKSNFNIIKDFLSNYKKFKTKPINIKVRPSKIIADYLLDTRS